MLENAIYNYIIIHNMGKSQSKPKNILYLTDKKKKTGLQSLLSSNSDDTYKSFYLKLEAIPDDQEVIIVITTDGGEFIWCYKICQILQRRKGRSRVYVKSYAHSAGSVIALSAAELYLTPYATLSAIDPQCAPYSDILQTGIHTISKFLETRNVDSLYNGYHRIIHDRDQYCHDEIVDLINPAHNVDNIMKLMHDEVPTHEVLFNITKLKSMGVVFNTWNGDVSKIKADTVSY
jgi:hypothetical protein